MKRRMVVAFFATTAVASAALVLSVLGCSIASRRIDVAGLGPATRVEVYEPGSPRIERPVAEGSAEARAVDDWLRAHAGGWRPSFVTYAPSRRIVAENDNLNFVGNVCVLNYRFDNAGGWAQLTRTVGDNDSAPNVFVPSR